MEYQIYKNNVDINNDCNEIKSDDYIYNTDIYIKDLITDNYIIQATLGEPIIINVLINVSKKYLYYII